MTDAFDRLAAEVAAVRAEMTALVDGHGLSNKNFLLVYPEQMRRWIGSLTPRVGTPPPRRSVYSVCACGGMIRYDDRDRRMPCPACGGTVTREEAEEAAKSCR